MNLRFHRFVKQPSSDPIYSYQIADAGTEQIYIDTDGTPYLYYTAFDKKTELSRAPFTLAL